MHEREEPYGSDGASHDCQCIHDVPGRIVEDRREQLWSAIGDNDGYLCSNVALNFVMVCSVLSFQVRHP